MFNIFKKNREKDRVLSEVEEPIQDGKKSFKYNDEVFELANEIETKIKSLLKEEGEMTKDFNVLLEGTGYTTDQIVSVQEHLQNLSNNSWLTDELIEKVFESLDNSQKKIEEAKAESSNTVMQMESVIEMFNQFKLLFDELQSQYKNIESFASIISNIANQTNLLSLNASIEAARAGEAGKGFAVVADEIKNLSVDTQQNAKDIMDSIQEMTSVITQLVEKSSEGSEMVSDTTRLIQNSGNLMDNIVEAEKEINEYVDDVKKSQSSNLKDIEMINLDLKNIVEKSEKDTGQFETLMHSVQRKADNFLYVLHHLNQIEALGEEFKSEKN